MGVFAIQQAPDWGWIDPDDGGPRVFFHVSALRLGCRVDVGDRVSYRLTHPPKGWAAKDVCPAQPSSAGVTRVRRA
ncbi:cold shock domain-containing protein [Candidatus Poribacteria bacterium]|nr:cold shock domain-containing protein [Candidatus Poribacteria bacterium]MBT5536762.1 cold shock domain-containing protein [Candidatus Poribacteria bacterium]MBT7806208.1 cold shock domain-containing protein [Candidatus Poribacteria bacterium]